MILMTLEILVTLVTFMTLMNFGFLNDILNSGLMWDSMAQHQIKQRAFFFFSSFEKLDVCENHRGSDSFQLSVKTNKKESFISQKGTLE